MILILSSVLIISSLTSAHPQSPDAQATILSNIFADDGAGNFNYAFSTSNGIREQASGQLKDIIVPIYSNGQEVGTQAEKGEVQSGSFSYTETDGTPITVEWIADENGFQPKGSHLPQ